MRKAFTLLEIIFVIVILGILSGVAVFYFRASDSELAQAKNQLINHIRYTQHLALMDDRFDPNGDRWYYTRWQMRFFGDHRGYYVIFSDRSDRGGQPDKNDEIAIDPFEKERLGRVYNASTENKQESITYLPSQYNTIIDDIECDHFTVGYPANSVSLIFDSLGRPYMINQEYSFNDKNFRAYEGLMKESCTITLTHNDTGEPATITIHPETGFVE
ncbi:MAG: Tfp pilus assembly protein FimT/FimU [Campylobacterales bacterium]